MENDKSNESIISFLFVAMGFIGYFITATLLEVLAGTFASVATFRNQQVVQHGLPVGVGVAVFLYLFLNKKVHTWANECVTEIRKVVWPSSKDTSAMTTVVCVMVVVSGLAFGVFDFFASQLIKFFVN